MLALTGTRQPDAMYDSAGSLRTEIYYIQDGRERADI